MSGARRFKKLVAAAKVSETPEHYRSKMHVASQLSLAVNDASLPNVAVVASIPCSSRHGQFFPCNRRQDVPFITLNSRLDLTVRTEFTEGAKRFDVALIRTRRDAVAPRPVSAPEPEAIDLADVPESLQTSIAAKLETFVSSKERELVLPGNGYERRVIHALAEEMGLAHESEGHGLSRAVVVSRRAKKRAQKAPLVATAVHETVAAFEILHTTPMTDEKVATLAADKCPWIEISTRDAENWRYGTPLKCVSSSLGEHVCPHCVDDAHQETYSFTHVLRLVDVFGKQRTVARHLFALLRYGYRNQESMAVVQYPLRFLDGLWLPVPPIARLTELPHGASGLQQAEAYVSDKLARFKERAAFVDVHVARAVAPRELFPEADEIAREREWRRPQELLVSLDRIFGVGRQWSARHCWTTKDTDRRQR
jgi:hypothetical protein